MLPKLTDQHGTAGPINIETSNIPITPFWFEAGKELGYNVDLDPNGPQSEGINKY